MPWVWAGLATGGRLWLSSLDPPSPCGPPAIEAAEARRMGGPPPAFEGMGAPPVFGPRSAASPRGLPWPPSLEKTPVSWPRLSLAYGR